MTKQEYYDLLVQSASDGTFPSYDQNDTNEDTGGCLYRGPNGTKCAFGILIPDDKYKSGMEGWSANKVVRMYDIKMPEGMLIGDIDQIQMVHDSLAKNKEKWDASHFIAKINSLHCFKFVTKKLEDQK